MNICVVQCIFIYFNDHIFIEKEVEAMIEIPAIAGFIGFIAIIGTIYLCILKICGY